MANIATYLQRIKSAIYGEEVRGSIYDALSIINEEASNAKEYADTAKNNIVCLTQEKYDALLDAGDVIEDRLYIIIEDDES